MDIRENQWGAGAREREAGAGAGGGLTTRQARFVEEYLVDGNGTQAAIRAGYAPRSAQQAGSLLLRKPRVTEALAVKQALVSAQCELDAEWVLDRLREVVERCLQAVPVLDRAGQETGEWTFDAAGATRALGLIGKQLGMFTERIDVQLLRSEAAQVAAEFGLDEEEVLQEADRWLKTLRKRY